MRTDCRHYDSRTYQSGDVVRKCRLDLAPDAPWKCPDECPRYERRVIDVAWQYGSLGGPANAKPDDAPNLDDVEVAKLLDEAEDIVNAAGLELLAEQEQRQRKGFFRKNKKKKKKRR
jgi:hypothetical protein